MKRIVLPLYVTLTIVLAAATFIERLQGTSFVLRYIYHNPAFILLWGALAAASLHRLCKLRMWRQPFVFMLHLSFLLILSGALTTFFTAQKGYIHLYIGESSFRYMEERDGTLMDLPFTLRLDSLRMEHYPGSESPSDYISHVTCLLPDGQEERQARISMNKVLEVQGYRFCQSSFDEDLSGNWLHVNHDPWGIPITYAGYLFMAVSMAGILLKRQASFHRELKRPAMKVAGIFLLSCFILLLLYWGVVKPGTPLIPVLASPWLCTHVSFIVMSYILLAVICINGIRGLLSPRKSARLMHLSRLLLYPAVFLLGTGIFIGAVWANASWGRYWAWDPKEVWALITFLTYGAAFHNQSFLAFRRPRFFHIYMTIAFLSILMTYFGVNFLLGGIHSYM